MTPKADKDTPSLYLPALEDGEGMRNRSKGVTSSALPRGMIGATRSAGCP